MLRRITQGGLLQSHDDRLSRLEQRRASRGNQTMPLPPPASIRPADVVVAASDGTSASKAGADFVCSGSGDATALQPLMDAAYAASPWGASVLLLPGTYDWDNDLIVRNSCILFGCGLGTHLEGNGGRILLNNGSVVDNFHFSPDVSTYGIMSTSFPGGCRISNIDLFASGSGGGIETGSLWRVISCYLSGFGQEGVKLAVQKSLVTDCIFAESGVHFAGQYDEVEDCQFQTANAYILMEGSDDKMSGCSVLASHFPNNTVDAVRIGGTRESFTDNTVRSGSSTNRCRYGVSVLGTATGARVESNDLRPGAGTWGTAAYNDAGTGTLTTNANDS